MVVVVAEKEGREEDKVWAGLGWVGMVWYGMMVWMKR